jgi:hypothetical protein
MRNITCITPCVSIPRLPNDSACQTSVIHASIGNRGDRGIRRTPQGRSLRAARSARNDDEKLRSEMRNARVVKCVHCRKRKIASTTLMCNANGNTKATISENLRLMSSSCGDSQGGNFELDGQVVEFVRLRVHRSY